MPQSTPSSAPTETTDWGGLWEHHAAELAIYARALTDHADDAEELIQTVLVRLIERRIAAAQPRPYLYSCLRHAATDLARQHRARRRAASGLAISASGIAPHAEPPDHRALRDALDRLPDQQREAVLLHARCGLTLAETASVLGCPLGTIASRYARALDALRADLRPARDTTPTQ